MAHDVFISFAIEDKPVAEAVCQALEERGVRCWYAPRDIPYTVDYEDAIIDAITLSKVMVLILSSHSNNSAHVKREVQNACREETQVPVLPFQVEDISLNKSLKYWIGNVNWLSALTPPLEDHLHKLVDYVQLRLPQQKRGGESGTQSDRAGIIAKDEEAQPRAEDKEPHHLMAEEHALLPRRRQSKQKMLLIVIGCVALLAIISFVWLRVTTGGGQPQTTQNEARKDNEHPPVDHTPITEGTPLGMVYVPGGVFTMGRDDGDEYERPAHKVTVKPFFIDIYEVSNEEYAAFVKETDWQAPPSWINKTYPPGTARQPVTGMKWDDARAYADWAEKRLPTEEEWEFAARGEDGRRYPWGSVWSAGLANADGASNGMAAVGTYKGASPFGSFDMVGNAWEWTTSDMAAYPRGRLPKRPASGTKVLRGGSYQSNKGQATATYRFGWRARGESSYTESGFRCVKDIAADAQEK